MKNPLLLISFYLLTNILIINCGLINDKSAQLKLNEKINTKKNIIARVDGDSHQPFFGLFKLPCRL